MQGEAPRGRYGAWRLGCGVPALLSCRRSTQCPDLTPSSNPRWPGAPCALPRVSFCFSSLPISTLGPCGLFFEPFSGREAPPRRPCSDRSQGRCPHLGALRAFVFIAGGEVLSFSASYFFSHWSSWLFHMGKLLKGRAPWQLRWRRPLRVVSPGGQRRALRGHRLWKAQHQSFGGSGETL